MYAKLMSSGLNIGGNRIGKLYEVYVKKKGRVDFSYTG